MQLFLATKNRGKIERFRNLLRMAGASVRTVSPRDCRLEHIDPVENGASLVANAEIKARAYFGLVDLPILANDTGFWVEGEGLVEAPKRIAFGERTEDSLSDEEKGRLMLDFWKGIARKHGGKVQAAWIEAFALLSLDGTLVTADSRRDVILTDQVFGQPHLQMPIRALYLSQATGKPAVQHTPDEERLEMQPVTNALLSVLKKIVLPPTSASENS